MKYMIMNYGNLMCCSSELSAVTSSTLTQELESIEQLHEMEPDNKCKVPSDIVLPPIFVSVETNDYAYLPTTYVVRGKVMFSQVSVILFKGRAGRL